ncbi:MAG: hypothetical protein HYY07_00580, partial [Elusimicrobia bacterium]|nr:hypothetical protein [Elusimicrobiota bacterium]
MKTLSQVGEFALIQNIEKWRHKSRESRYRNPVRVPLGDDAFVSKMTPNGLWAFTTDTLLEGTHFRFDWLDRGCGSRNKAWYALGFKSMAVNLSDLAAMGHFQPKFSFVTLGLNGDISVNSVENYYKGILNLTQKHNFSIVGGDIIRSEKSIISITLVGVSDPSKTPLTRSGAKPGQILMGTGAMGLSAAGLEVLKRRLSTGSTRDVLVRAHLYPQPKMKEGQILSKPLFQVSSLIDTSDDLYSSLEILSQKSRVGFEVDLDSVPIHPSLE